MAQLHEETHPRRVPMSSTELSALVAPATKEQVKARSQGDRDQRKEELRAQLFWFGIEHSPVMILPTLEKTLRQAVQTNKVWAI